MTPAIGGIQAALVRDAMEGVLRDKGPCVPSTAELVGLLGPRRYHDVVAGLRGTLVGRAAEITVGAVPSWYSKPPWYELRSTLGEIITRGSKTVSWDRKGVLFASDNHLQVYTGDRVLALYGILSRWAHRPCEAVVLGRPLIESVVREVAARDAVLWSVPGNSILPYTHLDSLLGISNTTLLAPYVLDLGNRGLVRVCMLLQQLATTTNSTFLSVTVHVLTACSVAVNAVGRRIVHRDRDVCYDQGHNQVCERYDDQDRHTSGGRRALLHEHLVRGWWHRRRPRLRMSGSTCADADSCRADIGDTAVLLFRDALSTRLSTEDDPAVSEYLTAWLDDAG
jgi:hypothetical protein